MGVNLEVLNRATFPSFILSLEQGKEDTDTGLLRGELLHDFDASFDFFKTSFDKVSRSYMLPAVRRMTHISQTVIQVLFQTIHQSWENRSIFPAETFGLGLSFHEVQGIIDAIQSGFDQRPLALGAFDLEIAYLVEKAALMADCQGRSRSNSRDHARATSFEVTDKTPLGFRPRRTRMSQQKFPGLLRFPLALDKTQELPFSFLSNPDRAQGGLSAQTFPPDLEVSPVHDQISDLFGDGPVQPADQLFSDPFAFMRLTSAGLISSPHRRREILPTFRVETPLRNISRNDFFDPLVLPPVAGLDLAVGNPKFSPQRARTGHRSNRNGFPVSSSDAHCAGPVGYRVRS